MGATRICPKCGLKLLQDKSTKEWVCINCGLGFPPSLEDQQESVRPSLPSARKRPSSMGDQAETAVSENEFPGEAPSVKERPVPRGRTRQATSRPLPKKQSSPGVIPLIFGFLTLVSSYFVWNLSYSECTAYVSAICTEITTYYPLRPLALGFIVIGLLMIIAGAVLLERWMNENRARV